MRKWWLKLFGKRKRQRRYVMFVQEHTLIDERDSVLAFLQKHTPVITAAQYNKLPSDVQKLFVRVGK